MRGSAFSGIRVNEDERVDTEKPGLAEGEHRGMRDGLEELKSQLRQLRAERRLSMSGLELRAGLGHTTVSKALNGPTVPSEATVAALAQALGAEAARCSNCVAKRYLLSWLRPDSRPPRTASTGTWTRGSKSGTGGMWSSGTGSCPSSGLISPARRGRRGRWTPLT